jgi:hypothetical protein
MILLVFGRQDMLTEPALEQYKLERKVMKTGQLIARKPSVHRRTVQQPHHATTRGSSHAATTAVSQEANITHVVATTDNRVQPADHLVYSLKSIDRRDDGELRSRPMIFPSWHRLIILLDIICQ